MKKIVAGIVICLITNVSFAQNAKFEFLKVKLKLNKQWVTDGFGSDSWDEGGSSVCDCAGVIIVNSYNEKNIKIVIYPSTKGGLDSVKRNQVWDYEFIPVEASEIYQTPYLKFTKKVSAWKDLKAAPTEAITAYEVWQLRAESNGTYYTVYVFAENLEQPKLTPYKKEIEAVLNTIQPMK